MNRRDTLISTGIMIVSAAVTGGGVFAFLRPSKFERLKYTASDILDNRDEPFSGYTIVEFMDYECPPCKLKHKYLNAVLHKHKKLLRLSVRHFPLDIHPFAKRAAYVAESYRLTKGFSAIHNKFMEIPKIDKEVLDKISSKEPSLKVKESVESDIKLGNKIGVEGTPTFILCCPDQSVYRIKSIKDIEELIK